MLYEVITGKAARKRGEMLVMLYPDCKTPYDGDAMLPLPLADAISANVNFRITSYNVCYTKLLRIFLCST